MEFEMVTIMKVYVLTYPALNWTCEGRIECICKKLWEVEVYLTREAAEAEAEGKMLYQYKILEKNV